MTGIISVDRDLLYCNLQATTTGGETRLLAAPSRPGLTVNLGCGTFTAGDNIVVTAVDSVGNATGTVTFTAAGQWAQLWSFETSTGVYAWQVTGIQGATTTITTAAGAITGSTSIPDGANIALGTSTGTKLGTAASQKLGFWARQP